MKVTLNINMGEETKRQEEVYNFLQEGIYPSGYSGPQRKTLRKRAQSYILTSGKLFSTNENIKFS